MTPSNRPSKPVAWITGASRGIGRAIAVAFAREGLALGLFGRNQIALEETSQLVMAAGGEAIVLTGDVTDSAALSLALRTLVDRFDRLDVLVNNAGVASIGPVETFSEAAFRSQLDTNILGPFLATKTALADLRRAPKAHIFNVGSVCSVETFPEWSAYCASKFGLLGFSGALRKEVRSTGIRVTDVMPGSTATEIFDKLPGHWPREQMIDPSAIADAVVAAWRLPGNATVERIVVTPTAGAL